MLATTISLSITYHQNQQDSVSLEEGVGEDGKHKKSRRNEPKKRPVRDVKGGNKQKEQPMGGLVSLRQEDLEVATGLIFVEE